MVLAPILRLVLAYQQITCKVRLDIPSLHSLSISSFNLYTLRLNGSFPCTSTFRLLRYFGSNLNGCLAPVVRSSVIISVGPAFSSFGIGMGESEEGPIAVENARLIGAGCGSWDREVEIVVDVWAGIAGSGRLFSFDKVVLGFGALEDCAMLGLVVPECAVIAFEARWLISTGVEETGSCEPGLSALVMS